MDTVTGGPLKEKPETKMLNIEKEEARSGQQMVASGAAEDAMKVNKRCCRGNVHQA
jgi:hypothetical protein